MKLIIFPFLFFFYSCSGFLGNRELIEIDLHPPVLQGVEVKDDRSLTIIFDEPVQMDVLDYKSDPSLVLSQCISTDNSLQLIFAEKQNRGEKYIFRGNVMDDKGNTLSFVLRFFGWNPLVPPVVINEFNPEGSGNNPDTIELFVAGDGNLAGVTLFTGTSNFHNSSYTLGDLSVIEGDYIIIHMRPKGGEDEINETVDKTESGGKLSSDNAWDIWVDGDKPLSGKNGLLSIYTNPYGKIIDAVPYSNRVSSDSEKNRGWTSTTIKMIEELSHLEMWEGTDGFISPEDAVNSNRTTGTRSICRNSESFDSDSRADWHIVPTGKKSFGTTNSDLIYTKKEVETK